MIPELDAAQNEKMFVQFSMHAVKDEARSAAEGRPIFAEKEYIAIQAPGDRANAVHRAVREEDKTRFSAAYRSFEANREGGGLVGTPLKDWPQLDTAQVQELAYFKCFTVEQLAGMSDSNLRNVGPILDLRKKAQAWLEMTKSAAPIADLQSQLDAKSAQFEALQKQVAVMAAALEAQGKAKK